MKTVEYRVRPVTRYVVTRYESEPETGSGSVSPLCECDHLAYAEQIKKTLEDRDPHVAPLPSDR